MKQIYKDNVLWCGELRNLVACGWTNSPTPKHMNIIERSVRGLGPAYAPESRALLSLVLRGTPTFDDEVRRQVQAQYQSEQGARLAVLHLILVTGLAAAATRAFLSTCILLSRTSTPTRIMTRADVATNWLASELSRGPEPWSQEQLLAAVRRVQTECS